MLKPLLLVETGGTIAMTVGPNGKWRYDQNELVAGASSGIAARSGIRLDARLLPGLEGRGGHRDSSDIGPREWSALAEMIVASVSDVSGVVVLHGTDTMAFTASALSFALPQLDMPVVLTGSQRPLEHEGSDALANIGLALKAASGALADLSGEVVIAFAGEILRGNRATKVSTCRDQAYHSPWLGALGPCGFNALPDEWRRSRPAVKADRGQAFVDAVCDVVVAPAMDHGRLRAQLEPARPRGVLFRLFGSGTSPRKLRLGALCNDLWERGIVSLAISAVAHGSIDWAISEEADSLAASALIPGANMTPEAGLTKLMWVLANSRSANEARMLLSTNIAGELDGLSCL